MTEAKGWGMRRLVVLLTAGALALSTSYAGARTSDSTAKGTNQKVTGFVSHATGRPGPAECKFEAHRIAMLMTGEPEALNGRLGFSFMVDPATAGQRFLLGPKQGAVADADFDIAFYASLGDKNDPLEMPERVVIAENREWFSLEKGRVPEDLPVAIVCLYNAETPAPFTYMSGPQASRIRVLYPGDDER